MSYRKIFFVLIFLLSCGIVFSFSGGNGTLSNPYQITTCEELQEIGKYLDSNFVLMKDINCYNFYNDSWENERFFEFGFISIGCSFDYDTIYDYDKGVSVPVVLNVCSQNNPFNGVFDGKGFSISNIDISCPLPSSKEGAALFLETTQNAIIKNLKIINSKISGAHMGITASLVFKNFGKIDAVKIKDFNFYGTLLPHIGGLVGENYGLIKNSSFEGEISNSGSIGGLVYNNYKKIDNCYTKAKIISRGGYVGGLVEFNQGDFENCLLKNNSDICRGDINQGQGYLGEITNSFFEGEIIGESVGGLVRLNAGIIKNVYSKANISAFLTSGGIVGVNYKQGKIENAYFEGIVKSVTDDYKVSKFGGIVGSMFSNSNLKKAIAIGTIQGYSDIGGIVGWIEGAEGHLKEDCDYEVCNPKISQTYFFGNVNGVGSVGGIAGYVSKNVLISESSSQGKILSKNDSGSLYIGGIVGYIFDSNIENCFSLGIVEGEGNVGGIAGEMHTALMKNNYFVGEVKGNESVGGLIGSTGSENTIKNSYSISVVEGTNYVSGLIGSLGTLPLPANVYWDKQISNLDNCYRLSSWPKSDGCSFTQGELENYFGLTGIPFSQLGWDRSIWKPRDNNHPTLIKMNECFGPIFDGAELWSQNELPLKENDNKLNILTQSNNPSVTCECKCKEGFIFNNGVCELEEIWECKENEESCFKNSDCCNELVCVNEVCGDCKKVEETCSISNHCCTNLVCVSGKCSLCGNGVKNAGENCENCPSDVKCGIGESCVSGVCEKIIVGELCGDRVCKFGEVCVDEECVRRNSIKEFYLSKEGNGVFANISCVHKTDANIKLYLGEDLKEEIIGVDCNSTLLKHSLSTSVELGEIYQGVAVIPQRCLVCEKNYFLIPTTSSEIDVSVPDNSILLFLLVGLVISFILIKPNKK